MPSEEQPSQTEAARASLQIAFKLIVQLGMVTLVIVAGALAVGLLLDRLLDTRPLFTLLLVLGGFPLTLYVIYRVALNAVASLPPARQKATRAKEERNRDHDDRS